jgi:predicted NAD/FAD-binding protein
MEQQPGPGDADGSLHIAVVGSGISGLSAAWLLAQRHRVTLFEADQRIGGHSHTVEVPGEIAGTPVDTGFIVFKEATYPNLTALFRHLAVETTSTAMTFAVSLDGGRLEYSGTDLGGLLAQRRNLLRPRFWSMLRDLLRFYREAPRDLASLGDESLDEYLDRGGYGAAFRDDHLYPMAAAIWSTPSAEIRDYPAASFIRFCQNHHLLEPGDRPLWHTVKGGSREYVARLTQGLADIRHGTPVQRILRRADGVDITTAAGTARFDHVVIATHADQALAMLGDADARESELLGAFGYCRNRAVLHSDELLMPQRRRVWSAWNYASHPAAGNALSVTYWMNRLQGLPDTLPLFVTLNPIREPDPASVHWRGEYTHPVFNGAALHAQRQLWSLQGRGGVWFCGAYFGAGFHEDGLQAGLAVAEQLGGVQRPWSVDEPSGRIHRSAPCGVIPELVSELESV